MYTDDMFFSLETREKRKKLIDYLNKKHPTVKLMAERSQTSIDFLDVTISLIGGSYYRFICQTYR